MTVKVECHEFISVEKVGPVIIAFSNKPFCEIGVTYDEGITWVYDKMSEDEGESINSSLQTCTDEIGYIFVGTSKGNVYRGEILDIPRWTLVNNYSFANDDPILYVKTILDGTVFAVSRSGRCIFSKDRGLTWKGIEKAESDLNRDVIMVGDVK